MEDETSRRPLPNDVVGVERHGFMDLVGRLVVEVGLHHLQVSPDDLLAAQLRVCNRLDGHPVLPSGPFIDNSFQFS